MKQFCAVLALLLHLAGMAWARGGGGCFEQGTLVRTPSGEVPIESLRVGDQVVGGRVEAITRVEPSEYLELPGGVHVTAEHPFQIAPGIFRIAEKQFPQAPRVSATRPAYNLLISPGGTFIAGGHRVHNKGCFLPDTPILKADGSRVAISQLRVGDRLLAFNGDGSVVKTTVRDILVHDVPEYLVVHTGRVSLRVTVEHPFYVGDGTFKTLESLQPGDFIYAFDGTGLSAQPIVSIARIREPTRVYNLQTDAPNTYFANGIAVHNKGGGCFASGTLIQTPSGTVAIENLRPGDTVLDGQGGRTTVEATFVTRSPVLTLETDAGNLRTTAEHPLLGADGDYHLAGEITAGDRLGDATVKRCVIGAEELVFNLRVGAPHTFVAGGFVVHNKGGGCFPAGTQVRTPHGAVPIENLHRGDLVLSGDGKPTRVESLFETRAPVLVVRTARGVLRTTAEHPLLLVSGEFRVAGEIGEGDSLQMWKAGELRPAVVSATESTGKYEPVFNLTVSAPHTFIADGFVVHNKGGGGFHGGGGYHGGGSANQTPAFFIFGIFALIVIVMIATQYKQATDENLDYSYSRTEIEAKAAKTRKLLEFIARVDSAWELPKLEMTVTGTFLHLQTWWESRDYAPMQPLLMPDLYREHCAQLAGMRRNHEINKIAGIKVEQVDVVHVHYAHAESQRWFTALISARATDYYVDDRTEEFLRGDEEPARFQEFWTFQLLSGKWLLRQIEQTRESDALKEENFFEDFTDAGRDRVYAETAGKAGPAGPWLAKDTETKATRIDRMLNFLVQTDKIWNRQAMVERAREVFLQVLLAQEARDPEKVTGDALFPDALAHLRGQMEAWRLSGTTVEYRNLCVRKVELVLVCNYADNNRDEFTARISAHAQRLVRNGDRVVDEQEFVTPFEQFWVFGRLEQQWKLKEVLPAARGEQAVAEENIDEDSSAAQLEWYYSKTRTP